MRIGFVCRGTVSSYLDFFQKQEKNERADLILLGFGGGEEVSYERELKGETHFFESVAQLSKTQKSVVVCGCITDTLGHKRKSAVVAENGKLLGVSDMLHAVDGEVSGGAALRVYETKIGRMGVAVAGDLLFPDVIKALATCGSDFIVCPYGKAGSLQSVLLRADAYRFGSPIFFCGDGYSMLADAAGGIAFASPQSPAFIDFKNKKEYHLVETRRRGVF